MTIELKIELMNKASERAEDHFRDWIASPNVRDRLRQYHVCAIAAKAAAQKNPGS